MTQREALIKMLYQSCMKSEIWVEKPDKHKLPDFLFDQQLKQTEWFFSPSSHSASSSTFPQGSVDLLITGSEVHYQCVHCQPSWLGLEEGHTDLIRRSWVLITSRAGRLWFHQCRLPQVVLPNTGDYHRLRRTDALPQLIWFLRVYLVSRTINIMMIKWANGKELLQSSHMKISCSSQMDLSWHLLITSFTAVVGRTLNMPMMIFIAVVIITVMAILLRSSAH